MSSNAWRLEAHHHAQLRAERQRLASHGSSVLSDRELLALLIGTGAAPGSDVHALVERLLARFGSVTAIARAHPADLTVVTGLGPAKAARLAAAFELARRETVTESPITINTCVDTVAAPLLRGRSRERLVLVVCDRANRVLGCEVLSEGSADRSLMPVRETMVAVLRRDGKAFALAHNHPSGDPTPSYDDVEATHHVRKAAEPVGLRFLNHVVVTDDHWRTVPRWARYMDYMKETSEAEQPPKAAGGTSQHTDTNRQSGKETSDAG